MKTDELDYHLPQELIAQRPAQVRDRSRLMVIDRSSGRIEHRRFTALPDYLDPRDLVVINDTRVTPARFLGRKESGAAVEMLLLREIESGLWEALVKGRRLRLGDKIVVASDELQGEIVEQLDDGKKVIRFQSRGDLKSSLSRWGMPPLPPYLKRKSEQLDDGRLIDLDKERYQTVYASHEGAVAAPTAGLHFTPELLETIRHKGVSIVPITLHVGLGTFQPIRTEDIEDHTLHPESFRISEESAAVVNRVIAAGGRVVAVGTTVTRTLETVADKDGRVLVASGETYSYIYPGYEFKVIKCLLTNFHLPRSTLLALVVAFGGYDLVMRAYREAVECGYRFYSYGDAMLIL